MGVGDLYGARRGPAHDWFCRKTAAHRVAACIAASAALFGCGLFTATHQRTALSPAGMRPETALLSVEDDNLVGPADHGGVVGGTDHGLALLVRGGR